MKRLTLLIATALVGFGFGAPQSAGSHGRSPAFTLPAQAAQVAPGVFYLGESVKDGLLLDGYAFARLDDPAPRSTRGNAKPPWAPGPGGGGGGGDDVTSCFSYIANGAKWKTTEPYLFNGSGIGIASGEFDDALRTWEGASGANIFGAGSETNVALTADTSSTDGLNEIYFASISEPGVLGFTIVWSTRRGRRIVEADMVIDTDWNWFTGHQGTGIDPDQLHFWSVVVHEAGHYAGMGHTPTSDLCSGQTMYPFISSGDDTKEALGDGDIAGINELY